jgi:hypothetical protein
MSDYRVVVMTSDKYLPALRPFAHLFNKYWSKETQVVVIGFANPEFELPDNFKFISIGKQKDYPFDKWSDALIHALLYHGIEDEAFVLMLEDYWLTRPVDKRNVEILYQYALQFGYVLKIDLCGDRLYAHGADVKYDTVDSIDLVKSMPGSPYHMSLLCGIWRRDNLLKALVPNETPHEVELIGTTRVSHMQDLLVLGTRQWPVLHTLGLRGGDHSKLKLEELKPRDVEEMRNLGYFNVWEKPDKS